MSILNFSVNFTLQLYHWCYDEYQKIYLSVCSGHLGALIVMCSNHFPEDPWSTTDIPCAPCHVAGY